MHSSTILNTILIAVPALAQSGSRTNTAKDDAPTVFPIPIYGAPSDIDNVQASFVAASGFAATITMSCGDTGCFLQPSPTLTVDTSGYRLNLGTVATQSCVPTSIDDSGDYGVVCTESTSGRDTASRTTTYTDNPPYATVTLTGGIEAYKSAESSLDAAQSSSKSAAQEATRTGGTAARTTSTSTASTTGSATGLTTTASTTGSTTSSSTSSASTSISSGAAVGIGAAGSWVGAAAGAFAWMLL